MTNKVFNKSILFVLSFIFTVFITSCSNKEQIPEFDGCYLKLSNGKLIELKNQKAYKTYIEGTGWNNFGDPSRRVYFVKDKYNMVTVNDDINGFIWKGTDIEKVVKYISIHPLVKKTSREIILPKSLQTVYAPGEHLKFHKKQLDKNTYFFHFDKKLQNGEYVIWYGHDFYLFKKNKSQSFIDKLFSGKWLKKEKLTAGDIAICNAAKSGNSYAIIGLSSKANNSDIKEVAEKISTANPSSVQMAIYQIKQICAKYGY